jgi:uncharacterized surface protein with fasciclin (FAS1) repeats
MRAYLTGMIIGNARAVSAIRPMRDESSSAWHCGSVSTVNPWRSSGMLDQCQRTEGVPLGTRVTSTGERSETGPTSHGEGTSAPCHAVAVLRTVAPVNLTRSALVTLLLVGPLVACADDAADGPAPTTTAAAVETTVATSAEPVAEPFDIVGTALVAGVFSQLAGMVVDAGLTETLRGTGPFTVFAPTNEAFQALPLEALHAVQDDPDTLATVLTYHVVPGALTAADLEDGALTTVAGLDLMVSHDGDQVLINGVPIAAPDVVASNGVIHVMGGVLLPPG